MKAGQAANLVPNLSAAPREYKGREIEETRGNRLAPSLAGSFLHTQRQFKSLPVNCLVVVGTPKANPLLAFH